MIRIVTILPPALFLLSLSLLLSSLLPTILPLSLPKNNKKKNNKETTTKKVITLKNAHVFVNVVITDKSKKTNKILSHKIIKCQKYFNK